MIEKKDLAVNDNSEMNRKLLEIKKAAYNPKMAAEVRRLADEMNKELGPYNPQELEEFQKKYPASQYLHLVYDEFDE